MVGLGGLEPLTSTMSTKRHSLLYHNKINYKIIIISALPEWKFKTVSVLRQVANPKEIAQKDLQILLRFAILKTDQI